MNTKFFFLFFLLLGLSIGMQAREYTFIPEKSVLKWNGKKVTGEHYGKVALKSGELTLDKDRIITGNFIIDLRTITCEDLPEGEWNDKLVGHLKSDDFFGVNRYPEAVLKIKGSSPLSNGVFKVQADLTIKGITKPVEFEARKSEKGFSALVTVDRSEYNVRYGSGKFFQNLGDNLIYDNFTLDVELSE